MASTTRLLSIHKTAEAAARSLDTRPEGWVEHGAKGTTAERPWAVVAPKRST
jgi:hypothetical protein